MSEIRNEVLALRGAQSPAVPEDAQGQELARILAARQEEELEILSYIGAEVEGGEERGAGSALMEAFLQPMTGLIAGGLGVAACIAAMISGSWLSPILLFALTIGQNVARILHAKKEKARRAVLTLDKAGAAHFLTAFANHTAEDIEAIERLLSVQAADGNREQEQELVRLYTYLYEAALEESGNKDLQYCMHIGRRLLAQAGLEALEYSQENRQLFSVTREAYKSSTLSPAVRRIADGTLVQRGEYIQDTRE